MADNIISGYVNPGYAVAGELQQIVARRKLDERTRMLDDLTRQKTEADINESKVRSDAYKAQQEAIAELNKQRAQAEFLKQFDADDDVTGMEDEWNKRGLGYLLRDQPIEQPSVEGNAFAVGEDGVPTSLKEGGDSMAPPPSLQAPAPTRKVYTGSPEQREQLRQERAIARYLQNPKALESMDPAAKALLFHELGLKSLPAEALRGGSEPVYIVDRDTGRLRQDPNVPSVPPHARIVTEPAPALPTVMPVYRRTETGLEPVVGPDNEPATVQRGARIFDDTPNGSQTSKEAIDESMVNALARTRRVAGNARTSQQKQAAMAEQATLINQILNRYQSVTPGIYPSFVETIRQIVSNPDIRALPVEQIIAALNKRAEATGQEPLDEAETKALIDLLPILAPRGR